MQEIATREEGAKIGFATSNLDDFPPDNIIDESIRDPWITDGIYPQTLVITFPSLMQVSSVDLKFCNIQKILVERSTSERMRDFEEVSEKEFEPTFNSPQTVNLTNETVTATHLRLKILEGHDFFSAIYRVVVVGAPADKSSPFNSYPLQQQQQPQQQQAAGDASPFSFGNTNLDKEAKPFVFGASTGKSFVNPIEEMPVGGGSGSEANFGFRVPTAKNERFSGENPQEEDEEEEEENSSNQLPVAGTVRPLSPSSDEGSDFGGMAPLQRAQPPQPPPPGNAVAVNSDFFAGADDDDAEDAGGPNDVSHWMPNDDSDEEEDNDDAKLAAQFGF